MKNIITGSVVLLPLLVSCTKESQPQRPNIIFIMSDDHALSAISAYGTELAPLAPTPNIDCIAKNGAIFRANYCCNSLSGPSRAAILTGKHSHKNGFLSNGSKAFNGSQQTLPKLLQAGGYQTAMIGKWHLISKPTGFDHWKILNDQGDYNNPDFITDKDTVKYMGYVTKLITQFTKEWLDTRDKDKPFFLMMHHKAPHRNWIPEEKYYRLYENTTFPVPESYYDNYEGRKAASEQKMSVYRDMYDGYDLKMVTGVDSDSLMPGSWNASFNKMTAEEKVRFFEAYRQRNNDFYQKSRTEKEIAEWKLQRYLQDYLSTVRSVDDSVGEILEYLKDNGLDENTIVVYVSDQGFYLGEHGWFDKRFMYEESLVMPMVMSYPKEIKAGSEVTYLTQNIDFAPTFLDMCGIEIPDDMQGKSFRPLLAGGKPDDWRKELYYHYYEYPDYHSVKEHYGIKGERYKLMNFYKDNDWELYDLESDPQEMNNLYGRPGMEEITLQLKESLVRLQQQYEVPEELCK